MPMASDPGSNIDPVPDFDNGPALRTVAMPADANPNGDIFGGWLLSQMDIAGATVAVKRAAGRVATIGIEAMKFHAPVLIGDDVVCYAAICRTGRTSIGVRITTFARRRAASDVVKVTEGVFTYVAIDENRGSRPLPPGPHA